jgi:choline dehydrogenase-like flavoprotein
MGSELEALRRREGGDIQHAAGSCRMAGFNDANGVVNPDGTVKGVAALRVADASIMPSDSRADTHFAAMVIGEAIARMMMRKTDVSNNAAALAL